MIHVSYSRASAYASCPYKHFLGYVMGFAPKKPIRPLKFGSDFHSLLEHRGNKAALKETISKIKDTYYELPSAWQQDLGSDYLDDLRTIFNDYCKVYADAPQPTITELRFELDLSKVLGLPVSFVGIIDEIYKRKDKVTGEKYIKLGEHKTFSRKPDQTVLVMNTQKCLYAKAVEFLYGMLPISVIWDYIHSAPADQPLWLDKSKRFSNRKSQKITPYSWMRACKAHGITDKHVLSQGHQYAENIPNFFFRYDMDIVPTMVNQIWDWFLYTADQIARHGESNRVKCVTRDCVWCNFKDICYAELNGSSTEHIIDNDFELRKTAEAVQIEVE